MGPKLEIITDTQILRRRGKKVSKNKGKRVGEKLLKFVTYNWIDCLGLAAIQVGIEERVFILHDNVKREFAIFINPKILELGATEAADAEGCLSIPNRVFLVKRPSVIVVKDAVRTQPLELSGWTARAWLHEYDHTRGVLISDIAEEELDPEKNIPRYIT